MVKDILTDKVTSEVLIKNGDFVIGDSDEQNLEDLIMSEKADYKQSPLTGAGGRTLKNVRNERFEEFESEIKSQLDSDKWLQQEVQVEGVGQIRVVASKL